MKNYRLSVVIEKDVEGYFTFCPELQGGYTQGDCYEEALGNIKDAIRIHLADRIKDGGGDSYDGIYQPNLFGSSSTVERFKELMM